MYRKYKQKLNFTLLIHRSRFSRQQIITKYHLRVIHANQYYDRKKVNKNILANFIHSMVYISLFFFLQISSSNAVEYGIIGRTTCMGDHKVR